MSQRRACSALNVDRSTVLYQSCRAEDPELRDAIKRVSKERRRFGYHRIHVKVQREGFEVNHKKLRRIYREEKLQVRRRGGRKRALGTRRPMLLPQLTNERWSLDFVSDAFTDGRRFRILAVVDDHTRENLALIADTSLSGLRVTRELDRVISERGRPGTIVSDNGTEFTSMAILRWVCRQGRNEGAYGCRTRSISRRPLLLLIRSPRRAGRCFKFQRPPRKRCFDPTLTPQSALARDELFGRLFTIFGLQFSKLTVDQFSWVGSTPLRESKEGYA